jgi:hypothetical protein
LESGFGQLKNLAGGKLTGCAFAATLARATVIKHYRPTTTKDGMLTNALTPRKA